MKTVIRKQYRAQLREIPEKQAQAAFALCREQAAALIRRGGAMTSAMYRYGRQLFLYMEFLGEELSPEAGVPFSVAAEGRNREMGRHVSRILAC